MKRSIFFQYQFYLATKTKKTKRDKNANKLLEKKNNAWC